MYALVSIVGDDDSTMIRKRASYGFEIVKLSQLTLIRTILI